MRYRIDTITPEIEEVMRRMHGKYTRRQVAFAVEQACGHPVSINQVDTLATRLGLPKMQYYPRSNEARNLPAQCRPRTWVLPEEEKLAPEVATWTTIYTWALRNHFVGDLDGLSMQDATGLVNERRLKYGLPPFVLKFRTVDLDRRATDAVSEKHELAFGKNFALAEDDALPD